MDAARDYELELGEWRGRLGVVRRYPDGTVIPDVAGGMGRYFPPGVSSVWLVITIAANAPSVAEMSAATTVELTEHIETMDGWQREQGWIETPDLGSKDTGQLPGRRGAIGASITLYDDDDPASAAREAKDALDEGLRAYIVWAPYDSAPAVGDLVTVFPVQIGTSDRTNPTEDSAQRYVVTFGGSGSPQKDVAVVA